MTYEPCPFRRRSFQQYIQRVSYKLPTLFNEAFSNQVQECNTSRSTKATQVVIPRQELSKYNGKNGFSAYVAINGIVYDVTNNPSWINASHFGLLAGKDLTQEYNSCHTGQSLLGRLSIVGKIE
ncbi:cytochrome B5 [Heliobacillus mobilis]|uniref:Cytochrome B5 n=2 Tax=Heliobacterium mobile TaxID=28064 RepID=A0A6I3SDN4_HELMO|nr:cytochrome B5 [Heliobacterium mobile]